LKNRGKTAQEIKWGGSLTSCSKLCRGLKSEKRGKNNTSGAVVKIKFYNPMGRGGKRKEGKGVKKGTWP